MDVSITITRPLEIGAMPQLSPSLPAVDRYQVAVDALTRSVLDAEFAGQREASVAYLSLRSALISVHAAENPGMPLGELLPWSFAEADRLVEAARIVHRGADTSSAEILRNAAEVMRCNLRVTGEFYDKALSLAKGVAPANCPVDLLGAVAISCGLAPDVWERWRSSEPAGPREVAAAAAARAFAHHLDIHTAGPSIAVLVDDLGAWHDGVSFDDVLAELEDCAGRLEAGRRG